MCKLVPYEFKENKSLVAFESAIKNWQHTNFSCGLGKTYICRVGFV